MSVHSPFRDIFFEEAEDLLQDLRQGLDTLSKGDADDEVLGTVFRAAHSMKGGASAFGFDDLVGFAHSYEVLLKDLRSAKFALDENMLFLLKQSADMLADLVCAARDGSNPDATKFDRASAALREILGDAGTAEEDFSFETLATDIDFDVPPIVIERVPVTYRITFAPQRDLYATGNEPLVLIRALQDLGTVTVTADLTGLPDFAHFDWEESRLVWDITIVTDAPEYEVRDIFEFVEGLCELVIRTEPAEQADNIKGLNDEG